MVSLGACVEGFFVDSNYAEIDVLIFSLIKFQFKRNSLTNYLDIDGIESIYVKCNVFFVFLTFSWSESYGILKNV